MSDDARERAEKIDKRYAEGDLVRVAGGRNQAEAELIQNILLEEGIPSMLRRSAGFDVPDFLAAGPRDVMVPRSGLDVARETLNIAGLAGSAEASSAVDPRKLFIGIVLAIVLVAVIVGLGAGLS